MTPEPAVQRIAHLIDVPGAAKTLARWYVEEWSPWYGPDGDGDAAADLAACASRDELPICLVALGARNEVLGSACLRARSVGSEIGVGPWLAGVLVGKAHRGTGIGRALAEAIEKESARLGFTAIHVSTDADTGAMARRGWERIGATESLRGPIEIFRKEVRSRATP